MKTNILLIVAWLAAVSAHSSLRHHENSLEILEDFKGRTLRKEKEADLTTTTVINASRDNDDRRESRDNDDRRESPDNDERESRDDDDDDDDDDDRESGDNNDQDSTTRAQRDGHRRGGQDFCGDIYVVDEDFHCAEEVKAAIGDTFTNTEVHLVENCNRADDDEEVCLRISNSRDCDKVVDDALDELDVFCFADNDEESDRYFSVRRSNYCDDKTLFDDGHECLDKIADAIEKEFEDTSVSVERPCSGNLCLMISEDEDDCDELSDAFVKFLRKKCSSEIRSGWDHNDGYFPNAIRIHMTRHGDRRNGDRRDDDTDKTGGTKDTGDTDHSNDSHR